MSCAAFLSINAAQINLCDLKRSRVLTLATCSLCFRRFVRRRSGEFKRSVPESSPWVLFASFSFGFPGNDKLDLFFFFKKWFSTVTHRLSDAEYFTCGSSRSHVHNSNTHTHTDEQGTHLSTGDSWRSQDELPVNSPESRTGFRL